MSNNALSGPWPDVAIPPGETLADVLEAKGLTQAELARRMGRPAQVINEIIKGTKSIEPATALQLERVLGTPAHFWLNLESGYRYNKARLSEWERLREQTHHLADFPYAEAANLGWVPQSRAPVERVRNLLQFFGVASLEVAESLYADALHRTSATHSPSWQSLAVWLRGGELIAAEIGTAPYDEDALEGSLAEIRRMTLSQPEHFRGPLHDLLASCGVAIAFVPHLRKSYAHGATRWLTSSKALVQLSLRGSWADVFWFTLFHELGHILRHGKRQMFVELEDGSKTPEEEEADRLAADSLLPAPAYRQFVQAGSFSRSSVQQFARAVEVHPGIVVGRLQHEGLLPHSHANDLRERYVFAPTAC
jgi:HTH-type transcriptional regulator/antitoxin HigA